MIGSLLEKRHPVYIPENTNTVLLAYVSSCQTTNGESQTGTCWRYCPYMEKGRQVSPT